jgi:hypothetical protein
MNIYSIISARLYAIITIYSPHTMSGCSVDIELQRLSEDNAEQDKLHENETQAAEHEPLLADTEYVNLSLSAATEPTLT